MNHSPLHVARQRDTSKNLTCLKSVFHLSVVLALILCGVTTLYAVLMFQARELITQLRDSWLGKLFPFDQSINFHILCGILVAVAGAVHIAAWLFLAFYYTHSSHDHDFPSNLTFPGTAAFLFSINPGWGGRTLNQKLWHLRFLIRCLLGHSYFYTCIFSE